MHVRVLIEREGSRTTARCVDMDLEAEGATREQALAALREGVRDKLRVVAIAPPERSEDSSVELVVLSARDASARSRKTRD